MRLLGIMRCSGVASVVAIGGAVAELSVGIVALSEFLAERLGDRTVLTRVLQAVSGVAPAKEGLLG